jgi:hypothetical protein
MPASDAVTYTLQHPSSLEVRNISVKWLGLNGAAHPGRHMPPKRAHLEHLFHRLKRHLTHHNMLSEIPAVTFGWLNNITGVLAIREFSPAGADEDEGQWLLSFASNITNALTEFQLGGGEKLVLDLTGNGGGDICLGYSNLRMNICNVYMDSTFCTITRLH